MPRPIKLALLGALFLLAGCGSTDILVRDRLTVIEPPAALFVCPPLPPLPAGPIIQDTDNAILIAKLAQVGIACHQSLDAIKQNIIDQKADIAKHPVKDSVTTP